MPYAIMGRARYLRADRHDEQDPRLRISETLPHLIGLKVVVLYALSVCSHPLHGNDPLPLVEEPRGGGEVRHEG